MPGQAGAGLSGGRASSGTWQAHRPGLVACASRAVWRSGIRIWVTTHNWRQFSPLARSGLGIGAVARVAPHPRPGPARGWGSPNATSQKSDARVTSLQKGAKQADLQCRTGTQNRHGRKCLVSARNVVGRSRPVPAVRFSPYDRNGVDPKRHCPAVGRQGRSALVQPMRGPAWLITTSERMR